MKRVLSILVAAGLIVGVTTAAHAWFWDKPKEDKAAATAQPKKEEAARPAVAPAPKTQPKPAAKTSEKAKLDAEKKAQEARKAKRELVEKKRREIDNLEWGIQLSPLSGKGKKFSDTVVFKDGTVSFKEFGKKGFSPSNFSLKIQEDDVAVWETMQTAEKAGVAFWRGEISPDIQTMRGVLSYRIDDKTKEDYSFINIGPAKAVAQEKK